MEIDDGDPRTVGDGSFRGAMIDSNADANGVSGEWGAPSHL